MAPLRLRMRIGAVLVLALVAGACTGTSPERAEQAIITDAPAPGSLGESPGSPADGAGQPTAPGGDAGVVTAPPSGATSGGAGTSGGSGGATGGGSTRGGGSGGATEGGGDGGEPAREPKGERQAGPPEAQLYDDEEKFQGISDDRIHLCGHAALIFAEAFDTRVEDLNVYWQWVNDNGGIHGRRVTMSWKDDAYSPDQAVQAAQSCDSENPFMLIGGIGFDQIPSVRNWAEQNRMLYLHHIAVAPDRTYNFSYSAQPTVDETGRAFGEYIASRHGDKPVGILWRQSEFWEPGHRRGREVLDAAGVDVRADIAVQRNQGLYSQEIAELQTQGVEVAWIWENALAAAQIIQQAEQQGYRPKWIVFPFQTTLDVVGEAALDPTIEGVASWSAYVPGGFGGAHAEHGYDEEIKRFEEAYARYRDRGNTNDILWQVWVGNKWLHDLLEKCGRDCNRNRIAGMFLSGHQSHVEPNCATDFAHENSFGGHIGGHEFFTLETFRTRSGGPGFETTGWCSARLN